MKPAQCSVGCFGQVDLAKYIFVGSYASKHKQFAHLAMKLMALVHGLNKCKTMSRYKNVTNYYK